MMSFTKLSDEIRFKTLINLNYVTEEHNENLYHTIARYVNTYDKKFIIIEIKNNLKPPFSLESNDFYSIWNNYVRYWRYNIFKQ